MSEKHSTFIHLSLAFLAKISFFIFLSFVSTNLQASDEKGDTKKSTYLRRNESQQNSLLTLEESDQTKASPAATFDSLPDEVKLIIFSFLKLHEVIKAERVCKEWQRLLKDNNLWRIWAGGLNIPLSSDAVELDYRNEVLTFTIPSVTTLEFKGLDRKNHWIAAVNTLCTAVAGYIRDPKTSEIKAFVWTANKGVRYMENSKESVMYDINQTGTRAAGVCWRKNMQTRVCQWTPEEGFKILDSPQIEKGSIAQDNDCKGTTIEIVVKKSETVPLIVRRSICSIFAAAIKSDEPSAEAYHINKKAKIMAGATWINGHPQACYWTDKGSVDLGQLGEGCRSIALRTNEDGSIIAGRAQVAGIQDQVAGTRGDTVFVWTKETGMVALEEVLKKANLSTNGQKYDKLLNLSQNGKILIVKNAQEITRIILPDSINKFCCKPSKDQEK